METNQIQDLRTCAVISVPLCGWNPHWGCHTEAIRPLGIEMQIGFGAWWDHSISNLFEYCITKGYDWILAMDYDSMFTCEHVSSLMKRFGEHPEIDALAALQCRRGSEETPLMTCGTDTKIEVNGEAIKVDTAHFGLTLFRAECINRMPKPWFLHQPDEAGSYLSKRRVDPDIYFWRRWAENGFSAYVDPLVRIGHLQPMVAEFDENYQARHRHFIEYRNGVTV